MSILKFENWDGVTAPAIPSGWTVNSPANTKSSLAGGIAPISSINVLGVVAQGGGAPTRFATWGTQDTNNGDVAVSAYFNNDANTDANVWGLFARCNVSAAVRSTSTFYWWNFDLVNLDSRIDKVVAGSLTNLSIINVSAWTVPQWYLATLRLVGSNLSASIQRLSDNFYLDATGTFVSGATTCNSATDSSITGVGYSGLTLQSRSDAAYSDNWTLETADDSPLPGQNVYQLKAHIPAERPSIFLPNAIPDVPSPLIPGGTPVVSSVPISLPTPSIVYHPSAIPSFPSPAIAGEPIFGTVVPPMAPAGVVYQPPGIPSFPTTPIPGNPILGQVTPTLVEERRSPPLSRMPEGVGAPLPTFNAVAVFASGLGNLGCCQCDCCNVYHVFCGNTNIAGATVTIKDAPAGTTIDSGVTDASGNVKLCTPAKGTYYLTVSGTGHTDFTDRAYTLDCGRTVQIGVCFQVAVYVLQCSFTPVVAQIVVKLAGITVGSGVTSAANGCATVATLGNPNTYEIIAAWSGQSATQTIVNPLDVSCGVNLLSAGFGIWKPRVFGCAGPFESSPGVYPGALEGATVTVNGIPAGPQVTDAAGNITGFLLAPGTYTYSITRTRFTTITGSFAVFAGNAPNAYVTTPCDKITMLADPSYQCFCFATFNNPACNIPVTKGGLDFTDSVLGSTVLTFGTYNLGPLVGLFTGWYGTLDGHGSCCVCTGLGKVHYLFSTGANCGTGAIGCCVTAIWTMNGAAINTAPCFGALGPCLVCPDDSLLLGAPVSGFTAGLISRTCQPFSVLQFSHFPIPVCSYAFGIIPQTVSNPWGCAPIDIAWTLTEP